MFKSVSLYQKTLPTCKIGRAHGLSHWTTSSSLSVCQLIYKYFFTLLRQTVETYSSQRQAAILSFWDLKNFTISKRLWYILKESQPLLQQRPTAHSKEIVRQTIASRIFSTALRCSVGGLATQFDTLWMFIELFVRETC